ncbi:MAG: hypothetical protein AAB403_05225 [Planctomycetota bacterium]
MAKNTGYYMVDDARYVIALGQIKADLVRKRLLGKEQALLGFIAERKKIEVCHCGHIEFDLGSARNELCGGKHGWQGDQDRLNRLEGLVADLERELRSERYSSWKDVFGATRQLWQVREALERFL